LIHRVTWLLLATLVNKRLDTALWGCVAHTPKRVRKPKFC
jgi:hypothetical protein